MFLGGNDVDFGRKEIRVEKIYYLYRKLVYLGTTREGGGGGTPGNSWWRCAAQFSKS